MRHPQVDGLFVCSDSDDDNWDDVEFKAKTTSPNSDKPVNRPQIPVNSLAALASADEIDSSDVQGLSVGQLRDRITRIQEDTTADVRYLLRMASVIG